MFMFNHTVIYTPHINAVRLYKCNVILVISLQLGVSLSDGPGLFIVKHNTRGLCANNLVHM